MDRCIVNERKKTGVAADSGMITLEAAILGIIAIYIVCLSVYIALILFSQAQLQTSASYSAQRVSSIWFDGAFLQQSTAINNAQPDYGRESRAQPDGANADPGVGTVSKFRKPDLYRRLFDAKIVQKREAASGVAEKSVWIE